MAKVLETAMEQVHTLLSHAAPRIGPGDGDDRKEASDDS